MHKIFAILKFKMAGVWGHGKSVAYQVVFRVTVACLERLQRFDPKIPTRLDSLTSYGSVIAQLVEPRRVGPEVTGSGPALVSFSSFIQIYLKTVPSQFPLWFITYLYKKALSLYGASPTACSQVVSQFGREPWLKGSIWFHDFRLAHPNKDIDKMGRPPVWGWVVQLVEPRCVGPEVAGSGPALVNFSSFIQIYLKTTQSVSLVVYYMKL